MIGFMGTDIHGFIEVRNSCTHSSEPDDDELFFRWHSAIALDHVYGGRSYEAFGCLFGVRGGSFEPLAAQRGFPRDASRAVARAFEREREDSHNPSCPPIRGRVGHPRRRPDSLFADRGYDHDIYRDQVRQRRIVAAIARRGTLHGTGLGKYRWVVERSFAWLHGFKRLRIRWGRRADIHEAFLKLACCLITHRQIDSLCRPMPVRETHLATSRR